MAEPRAPRRLRPRAVCFDFGIRAHVGGNYGNASGAGLFCWNLNNPASNSNVNIGCRLASPVPEARPSRGPGQRTSWRPCSIPAMRGKPRKDRGGE